MHLEFKLGSREAAKKDKGTEGVTVDEAFVGTVGFTEIGEQMLVSDLKVFEVFSVGRSLFKSQKLEGARLNLGSVDAAMDFDDELV